MKAQFPFRLPIIQAPMAGGITTPELVAAVSNTGALGSLGAGYMAPKDIRSAIRKIRSLTDKPFNVNLFITDEQSLNVDVTEVKAILEPIWHELTDAPFDSNVMYPVSFHEQVEVLLEEKVPIFSFTFGLPSPAIIEQFKKEESLVFGTATTPDEADSLEKMGVDAIICQGQEAGGHRGTFSPYDPLYGLFPLLALTREVVKLPLIAAGGIMTGCAAKAALVAGAAAVQLGTAFLTTLESGANMAYKRALLQMPHRPTVLTNVYTGKSARAIPNSLMEKLEGLNIPLYPIQHFLTQKLRALAADKNRPEFMSLLAGQGYSQCQSLSAAELIEKLIPFVINKVIN
jgi:nitronate monooxygenase